MSPRKTSYTYSLTLTSHSGLTMSTWRFSLWWEPESTFLVSTLFFVQALPQTSTLTSLTKAKWGHIFLPFLFLPCLWIACLPAGWLISLSSSYPFGLSSCSHPLCAMRMELSHCFCACETCLHWISSRPSKAKRKRKSQRKIRTDRRETVSNSPKSRRKNMLLSSACRFFSCKRVQHDAVVGVFTPSPESGFSSPPGLPPPIFFRVMQIC